MYSCKCVYLSVYNIHPSEVTSGADGTVTKSKKKKKEGEEIERNDGTAAHGHQTSRKITGAATGIERPR